MFTKSSKNWKCFVGLIAIAQFLMTGPAMAATINWDGATGGTPGDGTSWTDPLNWQGDAVPLATDKVNFDIAPTTTVDLGGTQTAAGVDMNAPVGSDYTIGTSSAQTLNVKITPAGARAERRRHPAPTRRRA